VPPPGGHPEQARGDEGAAAKPAGFQNVAHAAEQRCSVAFDGRA
jgi:hypothetical protein